MREIEARIVGLLTEHNINGERAITSQDVEILQKRLGAPRDFAGEDADAASQENSIEKPTKQLMRDESTGMIVGVCNGIAAYLGVDVVWVRLAFIVLAVMTSGFIISLYIVLAFIMPNAQTSADKLKMRGQPVTLKALSELKPSTDRLSIATRPIVNVARITIALGAGLLAMIALGITIAVPLVRPEIWQLPATLGDIGVRGYFSEALCVLAGVLLAVLASVIAYSVGRWYCTRRTGISLR